jgi:hypothetical protein
MARRTRHVKQQNQDFCVCVCVCLLQKKQDIQQKKNPNSTAQKQDPKET